MSVKIAEYKYDKSIYAELIPEFNAEFTDYTYEDIHDIINPIMEAGAIDWMNGVNYDDPSYPDCNRSDFLSIKPSIGYYHTGREYTINYYWYDSDKQFIKAEEYDYNTVVISPENSSFLRVARGDWTGDLCIHENITTRTIECDSLPTYIQFGDYSENNDRTNSLLEVNYLDTSNVTNMAFMFTYCNNLTTLDANNWDTSNVTDMAYMFYGCESLTGLNVSSWDTSKVTNMEGMFGYYDNGDEIMALSSITGLENWDTTNVTNMSYMFSNCRNLTSLDVSNFDTSNVTRMEGMFEYCYKLTTLDVSNWNTSNVTNMYGMFYDCESLTTLDVSGWNTSKVTDMQWMFGVYDYGDETMMLTSIIGLENWDTSNVTNMEGMFCQCRNLTTLDVSNFDTSNVATMAYMFRACESLTELDVSNFDTSNVTAMNCMFQACNSLTSINISNFDTSKVTNIGYMFDDCLVLESIDDLSNWNVSSVTNMKCAFNYCHKLKSLDLSGWDVSNVTNMYRMFIACYELESLNLSGWDMLLVEDTTEMFEGDDKLEYVIMNNSDYSSVNKIIAKLPSRTTNSISTLDIEGIDDYSKVNIAEAESKMWKILPLGGRVKNVYINVNNITNMITKQNKKIKGIYLGNTPLL